MSSNRYVRISIFVFLVTIFTVTGIAQTAQPIRWIVATTMDGQIFPSLVYSMANLRKETVQMGNTTSQQIPPDMQALQTFAKTPLAIAFSRLSPGTKAEIHVKGNDIMESLLLRVDLSQTRMIPLPLKFKYDALSAIRQSKPINVEINVRINGEQQSTVLKTLTARSINDCPYFAVDPRNGDRGRDLGWMFAAYVNEDHPIVDHILKEALGTRIVNSFDGYHSRNENQVWEQVRAVWTALSLRGIKYSSITTSANVSTVAYSQHVRFLEDAYRSTQANCVDGSVLIASVLQKIGIHTELVRIPGHMFLRFYLDEDHNHWAALETTHIGLMLGTESRPTISQAIQAASETFRSAWAEGNRTFEQNAHSISSPPNAGYALLNIAAARKRGIIPIPYQRPNVRPASPSK